MFNLTEENRKQILQYLWSRPYGEVASIIGMLASLKPIQEKTNGQPKKTCPKCQGNGFIKVLLEEGRVDIVAQCTLCNSQGDVHDKEFDEYFDSHPLLKPLQ